jgi:tRNA splicing endonuclease
MNYLYKNEQTLDKFWNKYIDIYNLDKNISMYSMYDALYLKKLLYVLQHQLSELQYKLIIQATRFCFLFRQNIINDGNVNFSSNDHRLFMEKYQNNFDKQDETYKKLMTIGFIKNNLIKFIEINDNNRYNKINEQNKLQMMKYKYLYNFVYSQFVE